MRLNQFLARAGFGSRRACEQLVLDGEVTVNGHRWSQLATQVGPNDNVLVRGKPVKLPLPIVAMLHKPIGYLCTSEESTREKTIYDLLPKNWPRVVYVGRLDKESEGLLMVTNDGDLSQRLTHPSHHLRKTYVVTLDREFDFTHGPRLRKGITLQEGIARVEEVFRIGPRTLKVVLTQGLKRQIREMFHRCGYEVRRLVRVEIGELQLGDLAAGQHRVLSQAEVAKYFPVRSAKPKPRPRPQIGNGPTSAKASPPKKATTP